MLKIGSHVSFSKKGLLNAAQEAISYGSTSFMIYTGAPQNTKRKPMEEQYVKEGLQLMKENGIDDIVVHAPYIINLGSYKKSTFKLAVDFLKSEIDRTEYIGVDNIVLHPGSYTDKDPEYGVKRIAEGLNEVLSADQKVNIALETMAGKGSEVGRSFDELARIIDKVDHNDKLTVCFDTCHAHDAGYDIVNDFDGVMEEFDRIIGLDRLAVLHINDSKNFRGARKDRHAPVGSGLIGFETIYNIVHHDVAKGKPVILETPWIGKEKATKRPMYEAEIALLSDNAEKRFGERFLDDVEKLKSFFNKQSIQPQEFVAKTWEALKGQKQKNADKREPMERLYDLVVSEQLFKDYTEEAINHRLIAVLAERK
ncbi:deoxyribonuclease IV [Novibacillus thermophilus]|jgi:deoxyribonuclease-4|uniref:Probable endonuclease 4 n=1 Tax=Novibacillus thermophilus TaxID=1471761 RepID=A0A1U9K4Y6_9BACL|nr:deoxyribonuclease IV [Novibacillus thermophilus]AQS55117.1 deoxyribonuclease IV [Novibacillus thermophilus]